MRGVSYGADNGVENRVSTIGSATVTLPPLGVRYTRAGSVAESWCTRHGFAPNRLRLIAAASGLTTESASESSRSTHASTPRLVPPFANGTREQTPDLPAFSQLPRIRHRSLPPALRVLYVQIGQRVSFRALRPIEFE